MRVQNRIKHYQHQLGFASQKEYAVFLVVQPSQLSTWCNQVCQPSLETSVRLWLKLRERVPGMLLQDLVDAG